MNIDSALIPFEYEKKIREGQKGGVVLVFVNGKDEEEVIKKSRFIVKIVDNFRDYTEGIEAVIKKPLLPSNTSMENTADEIVRKAVDRFLGWRLPEDFHPDCGISFEREYNKGTGFEGTHEPVGTNLFTATQAEEMIRFILQDSLSK